MTLSNELRITASAFGSFLSLWACAGCVGTSKSSAGHTTAIRRLQPPSNGAASGTSGEVASVPILRVNSETVAADDLWRGQWSELQHRSQTVPANEFHAYLAERATALINDRIADILLYQQATLRDPITDTKALDRFVDEQIRKTVTSDYEGVQRRYEKDLEAQGQTLEDVREHLRRELVISRYLETELKPKLAEPTRAELTSAYESGIESLRRPPRRSMSLIDVRYLDRLPRNTSQPSRDEMEAAKKEARIRIEAAQSEIRAGASFADVARKYSDGLGASEGGVWGWVTKSGVRERFLPAVEVLDTLHGGEVSDIVETDDGYFLVRCDSLDPGYEPDFQSVQLELRDRYLRAAYNRMVVERVRELRNRANIEPTDLTLFQAAVVEAGLKLRVSASP